MVEINDANRPLSPHLTIYKPQLTSVLSIFHRITGVFLLGSLIILVLWFMSIAINYKLFIMINHIILSWPVKLFFAGSIWALWYHTCTGIRHLVYDFGFALEVKWIDRSAYIILMVSFILTVLTIFIWWL